MLYLLTFGMALGISAGVSPGPLLTLVISETFRYGTKQGIKVALAPVVSDLPIILLTAFLLYGIKGFDTIMGIISLLGAIFIFWTGIETFRAKAPVVTESVEKPKSLLKGVVVNVLNPHPYLFWISVGIPTISKAMQEGPGYVPVFIVSFYLFLVGSKVVISVIVGKSKSSISGKVYRTIVRFLGLFLWGLALILLKEGARSA